MESYRTFLQLIIRASKWTSNPSYSKTICKSTHSISFPATRGKINIEVIPPSMGQAKPQVMKGRMGQEKPRVIKGYNQFNQKHESYLKKKSKNLVSKTRYYSYKKGMHHSSKIFFYITYSYNCFYMKTYKPPFCMFIN